MTGLQLANILMAVASALCWTFVLYFMFATYRLDSYRQQMFALRDELFDYAMTGNIKFDDPAYALLRKEMNALIRFGHHITLFRLLASVAVRSAQGTRAQGPDWSAMWDASLDRLQSDRVREDLRGFHDRATFLCVRRLVFGSPILMVSILAVGIIEGVKRGWTSLRQLKRVACAKVLIGPFDPRQIEEQALGSAS